MRIGITGISGSLGTALLHALTKDPNTVVVGSTRDELKAEKLAGYGYQNSRIMVAAAGLSDPDTLTKIYDGCEILIHAAALKRISESVYAADEMVKTNIVGTMNMLKVARDIGAKKFVLISSDKAVEATNLYGSAKFCAECIAVQANAFLYPKGCSVVATRYGNVLGSRGSVVHIWREQAAHGKPLSITLKSMTRFILTLEQAIDMIRTAIYRAMPGDIVVPLLKAARMTDLAVAVMREAGRADMSAVENGLRPGGEKIHESLLSREEIARTFCTQSLGSIGCLLVEPSHPTWMDRSEQRRSGSSFPHAEYASNLVERYDADELQTLLKDVPVRSSVD